MGEQYFARRPASRRRPAEFHVSVRGHAFRCRTDAGVFSRGELDRGTELLLAAPEVGPCDLIMGLGCGYGALGIVAARLSDGGRVILTDVNERGVRAARENLSVNGIANAEVRLGTLYEPVAEMAFDQIVSNPPIRAGRDVVDRIISDAPMHLLDGGSLWLGAPSRQGGASISSGQAAGLGAATDVRRRSGFKHLRTAKTKK